MGSEAGRERKVVLWEGRREREGRERELVLWTEGGKRRSDRE